MTLAFQTFSVHNNEVFAPINYKTGLFCSFSVRLEYFEYLVLTSPQAQRASCFKGSRGEISNQKKAGVKRLRKNNFLGHKLNQECKHGFLLLT